ncbi:helix-turn-helix domain-containing protein [Methylocystis bryophila]|uniref:LysR family transcriptional regulator n=1 Tax=Methylocystis bryophila TaxID=655015 RepID=UPI000A2682FB
MSRRIRNLEGRLGAPLFIRSSSRVQLTPAGRQFAQRYAKIYCKFDFLKLE